MTSRELEVASSSEDESEEEKQEEQEVPVVRSLDDLPSDDSVSLASDDDDSSDDSDSSSDSSDDEPSRKKAPKNEDLTLAERLEYQRHEGVTAKDREKRRDRKAAALAKAKKSLQKLKEQEKDADATTRKRSKHAPTEVSSKRHDFFQRGAPQLNSAGIGVEIGAHRYKPRDPRMSSMSGKFSEDHFEHHYGFLEDMRKDEMTTLKRRIQARKIEGKKGQKLRQKLGLTASNAPTLQEDMEALQNLKHLQSQYQRNQVDRNAKRTVKRKIRDEVESGKRGAYFVKRKDLKRMELMAKYDELAKRGDGAVDKVLAKRRKKNKSKASALMG